MNPAQAGLIILPTLIKPQRETVKLRGRRPSHSLHLNSEQTAKEGNEFIYVCFVKVLGALDDGDTKKESQGYQVRITISAFRAIPVLGGEAVDTSFTSYSIWSDLA